MYIHTMYVHVCMYVCMNVCIYACMYVHVDYAIRNANGKDQIISKFKQGATRLQ